MSLLDEVRLAFRSLRKRPGFLVAALATLGIAIGANIAVFTLVNATMLRPLPFGDRSHRIVSVHASHASAAEDWDDARLSYPDLKDLRAAGALEDAGGFVVRNFTLQDGEAERVTGGSVTPNLFPLLGISPAHGRTFDESDAAPPGLESVVIITHGLWHRKFGGRADILGRTIRINNRAVTVVGVMPPGFAFPERSELYLPLRWDDVPRTQRTVATFGLLKNGQTIEQAQREVEAFAARLLRTYRATHDGWTMRVMTFRDLMVGGDTRRLTTMLAALADELRRAPGVTHAAVTTSIPTDDGGQPLQIVRGAEWIRGRELGAQQVAISPQLFATSASASTGARSPTRSSRIHVRTPLWLAARLPSGFGRGSRVSINAWTWLPAIGSNGGAWLASCPTSFTRNR